MNKSEKSATDDSYRDLLILEELSRDGKVTQRDISKRLGIALGLVNSYIKNLASKGYITVSTIPRKRYSYYLTPKGFVEKSHLVYQHLNNFTNLYNIARKDFRSLFQRLQDDGVKKVIFCGVDEVAEIAYLTLQEFDMELVGVVDVNKSDKKNFFGFVIDSLESLTDREYERVILTSHLNVNMLCEALLKSGLAENQIVFVGNSNGK